MNSFDRGMIKWMPFNSVVSSSQIVKEIINEKSKIPMPILSNDQKTYIEEKIINAYYEHEKIKVTYYYAGKIFSYEGNIKKIDSIYHKIYFYNKTLLFHQIIKVI